MAQRQIIETVESLTLGDIQSITIEKSDQGRDVSVSLRYAMRKSDGTIYSRGQVTVGVAPSDRVTLKTFVTDKILAKANEQLGF